MAVFTNVLLLDLLIAGFAYAQSTQCRYFEERNGKVIIDNQPLVYVCSIEPSSSVPTIIWNGTGSSFADCPSERIFQIGPSSTSQDCGLFSANASTIGDCYTSVLSSTASPELNGTVIQCTDNDERVKVGSATIIIDGDPINLKACPIYNDVGELHKIECSWSNFLKQSIEECYNITYTSDFNSHVARSATVCTATCSEASCYDTYTHIVDPNTEECIVKVETLGPDVFIDTERVSTANLFLNTHVDNDCGGPDPCIAWCKFFSRIEDEVYCMVSITGPDGVTYTSVSTERGVAGKRLKVELTLNNGLPLPPSTVYSYEATTLDMDGKISCSKVNSTFHTGNYDYGNCTIANLSRAQDSIGDSSVCVEGETPLFINEGTVCYTGTTPGSTAVYHCGEGYGLSSESRVLVCQYNGLWNGTSPTCQTCNVSDLGDPAAVDGDPSVCGEGETPLFINGGTLCYTCTTPGSTAVYYCGEGYEAAREVLRCQATGKGNSSVVCTSQDDPGIIIAVVVLAVTTVVLIIIIIILLKIIFTLKKKPQPEEKSGEQSDKHPYKQSEKVETQHPDKQSDKEEHEEEYRRDKPSGKEETEKEEHDEDEPNKKEPDKEEPDGKNLARKNLTGKEPDNQQHDANIHPQPENQ